MIDDADMVLTDARLEFAANGVLSTTTFIKLTEAGYIAADLVEEWEAEGLAD